VLEKDFVGISSSCVLLDEIVFYMMIMATVYAVYFYNSHVSFMQRNLISWKAKSLRTSLNSVVGQGSYMN
jgi:hypothetical protein